MLYGIEYGVLGNLVEHDALGLGLVEAERLGKVPGNGLSLAVFIGSQPDGVGLVGKLLEFVHDVLLLRGYDVFRLEMVGDVYAEALFLQVTDVPEAGFDHKPVSEILLNCFRLCGRLDYH